MKQPWMKFYPADWRADPKLRKCGLAARGLWADLMTLMHECEPYGHLTDEDGNAQDIEDLSRMIAAPIAYVDAALAELDRRGVLSRTTRGVIYSRRMVRDAKRSEAATVKGKKGGNPQLKPNAEVQLNPEDNLGAETSLTSQLKPQLKPSDQNGSQLKPQLNQPALPHMPEARVQKLEEATTTKSMRAGEPKISADQITAPPPSDRTPGSHSPAAHALGDALLAELDIEPGAEIPFEIMGYLERAELWAAGSISKAIVVEAAKVAKAESTPKFPHLHFIESILVNRAQKLKDRISRPLATNGAAVRPVVTYQPPKPIVLTDEQWIIALKTYRQHGMWSAPGNAPNCGGCLVPQAILDTHGYGRKKA